MAKKSKRQKAIKRLNLSDHTLDINIRKCNYNKFNFSDIEDYVRDLVGSRDYQYKAIKQIMIYLWGGVIIALQILERRIINRSCRFSSGLGPKQIFTTICPCRIGFPG
jgi:hypothetical protein